MKLKNFKLSFDRSFSKGMGQQIIWLVGIMLVVYLILAGISYLGGMYTTDGEDNKRFLDILFVLIDPGSSSEAMSSPLTIICAILGLVIFSGMLISVISNILERRVEDYLKGEADYNVRNHVVVLGFNKSIPSLLTKIHDDHPDSMIIVMSNQDSEILRDWIHANVESEIEDLLIVMNGDRLAMDDLGRLKLDKAKEIYLVGEADEEAHDTNNMECVKKMATLLPKGRKVDCHVQIDSHTMFSVLQSVDFCKTEIKVGEHLKYIPFNFNEIWSQKVLATIPNEYTPLDGKKGIQSDSHQHVHLIIFGMNEMGIALAVNAAHILHFPNFRDGDFSTCSHITFVDTDANKRGEEFRRLYHHLFALSRWRLSPRRSCSTS